MDAGMARRLGLEGGEGGGGVWYTFLPLIALLAHTLAARTYICDGLNVNVIIIVALQASAHVRRVHDVRRRWSETSCGGSSVCI